MQDHTKEMPTSSQAMILRGSDPTFRSHSNLLKPSITDCKQTCVIPNIKYAPVDVDIISPPKSPKRESCEVVKFDFSVTTTPDKSINGFQGVFAYDQKSKAYRWQICSVQPKSRNELGLNTDNAAGETTNPSELHLNLQKDELGEAESFVKYQPSEHTRHFTTPTISLLDNSPYVEATELHGKTTLLSSLNIPLDTELIDENSYRQLEQLGFRRRTTYSPGGALIRMSKTSTSPLRSPTSPLRSPSSQLRSPTSPLRSPSSQLRPPTSPLRSPQKCSSDPIAAANTMTKLSINNLDPSEVPPRKPVPFKNHGFQPKPFISRDSIRKRIQPQKQKTLLEEVKECVDWENRVSPSVQRRRGRPSYIPTAVCFSLIHGYRYSHAEVKDIFETQTRCKVKSLQFDPMSVRTRDATVLDRWVVTLATIEDCQRVTQTGIAIDGDHVVVRTWDSVQNDEYITEDGAWDYPCNYRLKSEKHNLILRNFLSVH